MTVAPSSAGGTGQVLQALSATSSCLCTEQDHGDMDEHLSSAGSPCSNCAGLKSSSNPRGSTDGTPSALPT